MRISYWSSDVGSSDLQRSGPKPSLRPARRRKHLCGAAPAPGLCFNKVDFIAAGPKLEPQAVNRRIVAVMTVQRLAEPSDLDARIAVLLRVEIFHPAAAIDRERLGFYQGATAGIVSCDDEPEQPQDTH